MARRKISKKKATKKTVTRKKSSKDAEGPGTITLYYIKSNQHRSIHVDGAFGSPSPHGSVNVSFYSSRFPIPIESTNKINENGGLDEKAISQKGKVGIIREVEISATMAPTAAENIGKWLIENAKEARRLSGKNK